MYKRQCLSLLGGSVYEIAKPFNNEDVPGFSSEHNYQFEVSCAALLKDKRGLYIISRSSLSHQLRSAEKVDDNEITISVQKKTSQKETAKILTKWGYVKTDHCHGVGTFSVRGGILDVFAKHMLHPVRIEFFNNTVESIRLFDIDTQLSVSNRKNIKIAMPVDFLPETSGTKISEILEKRETLLYITVNQGTAHHSHGFAFYSERLVGPYNHTKENRLQGLYKRFGSIYVCNSSGVALFSDIKPIEAEFESSFALPSFGVACLVFSRLRSGVPNVEGKLPMNVSSKRVSGLSELLWGDLLVHKDYGLSLIHI